MPPEPPPPDPLPFDPLLDGAKGTFEDLLEFHAPDVERMQDDSIPLRERLAAYEDITESEVGDTNLVRARNIEREMGFRQLFLKFEGGNPSGTQKDRIAFAQAADALRRGFGAVTMATCGNYGVATALACSLAGIQCYVFIPQRYHTRRVDEMERFGARIVRAGDDYEHAVVASREAAEREEWYDANPGGDNTTLQLNAYGEIAYEIYDELRDAPAVVAVSVSNGTTLAGIHRGFVSLYRRGRTSRIPKMVAGSAFRMNPIVESFLRGKDRCEDLVPANIRETETNEPLVNWHSCDGDPALSSIRATGGWASHVSDRAMKSLSRRLLDREGVSALPASTAGLYALLEFQKRNPLPGDRYVAVLTGRR